MRLRERVISICLSVAMLLSVAPFQAKAAENTTPLIEVTVTETTETGATIHIKNNKDYGTNQIGFYKVLKKSEQGFDSAQALITSFGDITDSTTMMAASIPEFLAGPPTFTAQTEATKTVSDLEAGTEYVVYAAIGDYYAMATSNDYSGCSFVAVEFTTDAETTASLIEVTVTERTETGATIHIKNNKDYGTNQIGFYKVLKKSEQGFDSAQALITSFGDITDSTTMMAACIPEFLAGPPTFTAQTEATKTVSDLEAGTEYVVYAAIGDYYAMATSNDYSGCSFAAVEFTTKTDGGGETPEPTVPEDATTELSYQENGKEEITTVYYEKFEDATVALNVLANCSNITLTLLQDTTIQPTKAYGYAAVIQKSCTLDLNGYVLTAYSGIGGSITGGLLVEGEVHFVLTDSSEERSGMILSKAGSASMITGLAIGSGFSDSVYEKLPGDITFEMNGTVVKDANYDQPKAVKGCLSISDSCVSAELNDSVVYGAVTTNCDSLELNNSRVEANTEGQRVLTFSGKLIMNESVIANTYDGSAESCTVSYYRGANEIVDVGTILKLTDSTISAGSGTALNLGMNQKVKYAVDLNEGAHILSDSGIGIYVDSQMVGPSWYDEENPAPHAAIHLYAGSVVSGASAIEVAVGTKNYKLSDVTKVIRIEMDDGAFLGYDNVPVLPNSSVMTYPTGMVLDVDASNQAGFEEYYTLKNTAEMDQIIDTITFGYQYLATLNATIEGTRNLYVAGNADNTYDTVLWNAFTEAYEAAIALIGTDETAANLNANQNEIDYREQQLSAAALALQESVDTVDLSNLANGTYSIEIQMMHSRDDGSFSMANGAVERTATLTIEDGKKTLSVNFKPMELGPINGHLLKFWVYNAPTPDEAKSFNQSYIQDNYVVHSNYYNQDGTNDPIYDADGMYPGTITFELPYFGSTDGYNKIYGRVSVDAMASDQNVIMLLQYHTLKAVSVQATLSVDADEMSLLKTGTQSIGAKVTGDTGWTLSYQSGDTGIATVSDSGTVTAVAQGETTVTVIATKEGCDALTKTVNVKVAADGAAAVEPEISGDSITISGDTIVTNSDAVDVADAIVIDASSSSSSGVTISFAADTVAALKNAGKDVTIQTGTGNIKLNAALLQAMGSAESGQPVELRFDKIPIPSFADASFDRSAFAAAYDLTLTSQGKRIAFGKGAAAISVPWSARYGYAYYVEGGKLLDVSTMTVSNGMASWTTDHFSVWALSSKGNLMEQVGIQKGVYSVPVVIKQANQPKADSMANDATGSMVVADVTDTGVTYTMFLKARVGTELGGTPLRGHLLKMWYYDPNDTDRANPISAAVVRTYQDKDMYGKIDTFPREVEVWQKGAPQSQYYIMVSVDAMGADQYQDALVKLYWDRALKDDGAAAREGFQDEHATEQTVESGAYVSRGELRKLADNGNTLLIRGKDSDLTVCFDTDALKDIYGQTDGRVRFVLEERKKDKLTDEQRKTVGDRPSYLLELTVGSRQITGLDDGIVEVTLPYQLKKDEVKDGLVVWLVDAGGGIRRLKCTYNVKNKTVSFDTREFGTFVIAYDVEQIWENPFTDVKEEDWFYEAVKYVVQKGLFAGTSETTFEPNLTMSRSMLVTVLYRLAGSPAVEGTSKFSDVAPDAYYTNAVLWATQNGIAGGYGNGLFGVTDPVSREQLAVVLYRYAQHMKYDVSLVKGLNDYTDSDQVSGYAIRAMQWAVANGIINGTSSTTLSPQGSATRSQVAVILMRFDEEIAVPAEQQKEEGTKTK